MENRDSRTFPMAGRYPGPLTVWSVLPRQAPAMIRMMLPELARPRRRNFFRDEVGGRRGGRMVLHKEKSGAEHPPRNDY